jgi:hypothetical protein
MPQVLAQIDRCSPADPDLAFERKAITECRPETIRLPDCSSPFRRFFRFSLFVPCHLVWCGRSLVAIEGAAAPADRGGLTQA